MGCTAPKFRLGFLDARLLKIFTLKFCKCSCRFLKFCEILEAENNDDFIFLLSVGIKTFYNFLFIHFQ